jgi:photosystem II stability/assembly factor-like uncharacterized protein
MYLHRMKKLMPLLMLLASCGKEDVSLPLFRELSTPVTLDFTGVCFADSLNGLVSGGQPWQSGVLLSTANGGNSWQVDTLLNRKMEQVCFDPGGQAYACGQDLLLVRPPAQRHWQLMREDFQWFRSLHFPSSRQGAVVSGEGYHSGQLRVFGPEQFWQLDTLHEVTGELESVWFVDENILVAVGTGWVIRSENGGQSWERLRLDDDFYTAVHFPDAQTGYICGNSGSILKSTDAGKTWKKMRRGGVAGDKKKGFRALWFVSAEQGWVVGDNGVFWQTTDGANTWQTVAEAPSDANFTDVHVSKGIGWATAEKGRLFRF